MYANYLKSFKIYFRDYLKEPNEIIDFKFPKKVFKPKFLPSDKELDIFYEALPDEKYKIIFILLRESGLRISELLSATIDPVNQMLVPMSHTGMTKHSYISFYRTPVKEIPKISIRRIEYYFNKTSEQTGIKVKPHTLRAIFIREMSLKGVPTHYLNAFMGHTPQSVLEKNYQDYNPNVLKEIYFTVNVKSNSR